jgi:hypothetical protein
MTHNNLDAIAVIDLTWRVKCKDGQMAADLGGELAIVNLKSGVYYGLNEVGARMWNLFQEGRTLREVRDQITAEYTVEEARVERDLTKLISELAQHDLIELGPGIS